MKKVNLGTTGLQVPAIAVGCMRLNSLDLTNAAKHIENAIAHDVNFFDHADIYGRGECEVLFGKALKMTEIKRSNAIFVANGNGYKLPRIYSFNLNAVLFQERCSTSQKNISLNPWIKF